MTTITPEDLEKASALLTQTLGHSVWVNIPSYVRGRDAIALALSETREAADAAATERAAKVADERVRIIKALSEGGPFIAVVEARAEMAADLAAAIRSAKAPAEGG